MASYEKLSTLIPILKEVVVNESNPEVVRTLALTKIKESKVNPTSKASMIHTVSRAQDMVSCIYNLVLKYEGQGVIR